MSNEATICCTNAKHLALIAIHGPRTTCISAVKPAFIVVVAEFTTGVRIETAATDVVRIIPCRRKLIPL